MKQVLVKQGKVVVEEIPAPQGEPGSVLVRVDHSCISIGTEMSGVRSSGVPLWKRTLREPAKVKAVLSKISKHGLARTHQQIVSQYTASQPTGYSAAGSVMLVGSGIEDLFPGDRVACAGAQYAFHAEIIRVPRNLCVRIPDNVDFPKASTVTLGAIALQGVRRGSPTLGETFVVIGLGVLGQLTTQILKANGCRVIGTDLNIDRITLARELGADQGISTEEGDAVEQVFRRTDGVGADGVIITAAAPTSDIISQAFRMCRRKGRVVLVGDVGLDIRRADLYQKELDFFISTSYGPGRYDAVYEEQGLDYPIGYVRWTENRNMLEYLRLLSSGNVRIEPLITAVYPVEKAPEAYTTLQDATAKPLMVLLSYPQPERPAQTEHTVYHSTIRDISSDRVRLAIVGAGGFARSMHLPNVKALHGIYRLQSVMSRTGHHASEAVRLFGGKYATTDYQRVLEDPEVDAVLLCTRHNLHAPMAMEALQAGKHVLVEKPLALNAHDLSKISAFYMDMVHNEAPILLTGFNRRFSPYARRLYELVQNRSNPMILTYRMNAGYLPLDHWVHSEEGGGRNIGEACHIYDLFTYLTNSRVCEVRAVALKPTTDHYSARDNFISMMTFEDGSIASLTYTAVGAKEHPKEQMEVFVDGKTYVLNDYVHLNVIGARSKGMKTAGMDKGHLEELSVFAGNILSRSEWPIPLWQQVQAMEIAFQVERYLTPEANNTLPACREIPDTVNRTEG